MKVLVIGSGGREHTLCWKINQSKKLTKLFCAPGNAGTSEIAENIPIKEFEIQKLIEFALKEKIDLTVVGPESWLEQGIVDEFEKNNLLIFGASKNAARIETSKSFSKELMKNAGIPTAEFEVFQNAGKAKEYLKKKFNEEKINKIVIKASGLAAGKGVILCYNETEALKAVEEIMQEKSFGNAGNEVVIEEFLEGEEASFLAFCDGNNAKPMVSSQDHKRVFDNDKGLNTGGMGAYSPAPVMTKELEEKAMKQVIMPALNEMKKNNYPFKGVLYAGLMIKENELKVVEFNARFGDPETQVVLPRMESDLIEIMTACCKGTLNKTQLKWKNNCTCCVVLASSGYPEKYEKNIEIFGLENAKKLSNAVVFHAGTKKENNKILTNGGRVLGVTGIGNSIKESIENAYKAVKEISFKGMHYRKDIGYRALKRI
ncbi:MAG: phosphoribosylamine--glycine ligase [Candidatus Diapherotrites archaeon]|nr:phosphoribosylamine--glycine ligase [Candidatus Diapherotrites archaeon]